MGNWGLVGSNRWRGKAVATHDGVAQTNKGRRGKPATSLSHTQSFNVAVNSKLIGR